MAEGKKKHRYKHSDGKRLIEVRVKSAQQLFDIRDPSPFRERDLDDDFVEYTVTSAQEFSLSNPVKIVIYIEQPESKDLPSPSIREAIHSFFLYQIDLQRLELRRFLKRAQLFLFVGLMILFICLSLSQRLTPQGTSGVMAILREGLVIFGWVSMWKPVELILFDWYPLFEKLRLYKKLAMTEIEIRFQAA